MATYYVEVTVQPHASRPVSHPMGCVGFWLWALVGAGFVFGFLVFGMFVLFPMVVVVTLVPWKATRSAGEVLFGMLAGAGLPLLFVAALWWDDWHHRVAGDGTPNPYYWGGVGLCLLIAGTTAGFAYWSRRRR